MHSQKKSWLAIINMFFLAFFSPGLFAQHLSAPDSLKLLIQQAKTDTDKVKYLNALSLSYGCNDSINKIGAAKEALLLSKKIKWYDGIRDANFVLGNYYVDCKLSYNESLKYCLEGVSAAQKCGDKNKEALGCEYIAQCYVALGQYEKTIHYYREMLNIDINQDMKIGAFSNIGQAYAIVGLYKTALDYYDSAEQLLNVVIKTKRKV